ncbi:hypothetical protein DFA_06867 [Cavenderia fasciculata]|uniref:PiggyBac transposable element-derived protein domain-containing protein n=1 Tax=Cavenderia fasciculata TaxID=261658 RepID=F4PWW4_CACFS|nr:uncharacterized protein DFA_06867 [Cavenderia fasciculata]EGG19767.1 hypothetical protein DFA_06867 [Cavenderia fasciculata]|eukprot:XP_004358113.1 hypothetical protein DFA_06867 [Cavenderia fasciculata]
MFESPESISTLATPQHISMHERFNRFLQMRMINRKVNGGPVNPFDLSDLDPNASKSYAYTQIIDPNAKGYVDCACTGKQCATDYCRCHYGNKGCNKTCKCKCFKVNDLGQQWEMLDNDNFDKLRSRISYKTDENNKAFAKNVPQNATPQDVISLILSPSLIRYIQEESTLYMIYRVEYKTDYAFLSSYYTNLRKGTGGGGGGTSTQNKRKQKKIKKNQQVVEPISAEGPIDISWFQGTPIAHATNISTTNPSSTPSTSSSTPEEEEEEVEVEAEEGEEEATKTFNQMTSRERKNEYKRISDSMPTFEDRKKGFFVCPFEVAHTNEARAEYIRRIGAHAIAKPFTFQEIESFIYMGFFMGIIKLPRVFQHWSTTNMNMPTPISDKMTRNRFQDILKYLRFDEETLVSMIEDNSNRYYSPSLRLSVDEFMAPFKGLVRFRQYEPDKPHKFGLKYFVLSDNNGFILTQWLYKGSSEETTKTAKLDQPDLSFKGNSPLRIPLEFAQWVKENVANESRPLENYLFAMDNFYTSLEVATRLSDFRSNYGDEVDEEDLDSGGVGSSSSSLTHDKVHFVMTVRLDRAMINAYCIYKALTTEIRLQFSEFVSHVVQTKLNLPLPATSRKRKPIPDQQQELSSIVVEGRIGGDEGEQERLPPIMELLPQDPSDNHRVDHILCTSDSRSKCFWCEANQPVNNGPKKRGRAPTYKTKTRVKTMCNSCGVHMHTHCYVDSHLSLTQNAAENETKQMIKDYGIQLKPYGSGATLHFMMPKDDLLNLFKTRTFISDIDEFVDDDDADNDVDRLNNPNYDKITLENIALKKRVAELEKVLKTRPTIEVDDDIVDVSFDDTVDNDEDDFDIDDLSFDDSSDDDSHIFQTISSFKSKNKK